MQKFLVTIEFRFNDIGGFEHKTKTIGVFDTFSDACEHGNALMVTLESRFPLHVFPSGMPAKKERFSVNGGPFGSKKDLISNLAYLKTPFIFFAKIKVLDYGDIFAAIDDVIAANKRYQDEKQS